MLWQSNGDKMKHTNEWNRKFLELAAHVAQWSKDPSTKVGAVIVRPDRTITSVGYNGFPRGVADNEARYANRETKYGMVVHAEINAILNAKEDMAGHSIYVYPPFITPPTCDRCAVAVIQSGIKEVVGYAPNPDTVKKYAHWNGAIDRARLMYEEAGINMVEVNI